MDAIDSFIDKLSKVKKSNDTTNLYYGGNKESEIRRNNLKVYLNKMLLHKPKNLFLGEAPGYKGCRLSGIAFTSEKVLYENEFFKDDLFQFINQSNSLESEISATIVWSQISKFKNKPLIWNIFPFHPHQNENTKSNRTPNKNELEEGKFFLLDLLKIFEIKKIYVLGRKPESQVKDLKIPYVYFRHPAQGGKNKFIEGVNNEFKY